MDDCIEALRYLALLYRDDAVAAVRRAAGLGLALGGATALVAAFRWVR
jgi:hypothetical protein